MASRASLALLRVLADGEFHSGAALGAQFNMTRAGIHHHIGLLREMGIVFEAVRKKGYRIPGGVCLLNPDALVELLPRCSVHYIETLPSTQDYLIPIARQKPSTPVLCVAECQTAGRGRGSKTWYAPCGVTLCFSLCVRLHQPMHALSGFTLALGVALCQALEGMGAVGLQLKWPNDVYGPGGKLAGILTEAFGDVDGPTVVVIGVGLNVYPHAPWADLQSLMPSGMLLSRQAVLVRVVEGLLAACECYEQAGFAAFHSQYEQYDFLKGKKVSVVRDHDIVRGRVKGVGAAGELLLHDAPGAVLSGSVIVDGD